MDAADAARFLVLWGKYDTEIPAHPTCTLIPVLVDRSKGAEGVAMVWWGLSLETFTVLHVLLSLVGIASGFVVLVGFLARRPRETWNAVFLITTVATSVTGFGFPVERVLPSHVVGIISLVVLAVAILARYTFHLAGGWGVTYVVSATAALYLNVFVGVVQAFQRIPVLRAMAPHQTEMPFVVAQLVVLAAFVTLTIVATRRFARTPARV